MYQGKFTVASNRPLAQNIFEMRLAGNGGSIKSPGQFVSLKLPEKYLRRPISVCDADTESITLIYKVLGRGTEEMTRFPQGMELDVLTGLGNGFDVSKSGDRPLLIGGGVGLPPMYMLAKRLISAEKRPVVIIGANTRSEVFYENEFRELGVQTVITTADGSRGIRGLVTDAMDGIDFDSIFACGPEPMLKAVYERSDAPAQLSFEERMGCGFGACMGCSCMTKYGAKRICRDGPVLHREEIVW